jgi:hypothetical protein
MGASERQIRTVSLRVMFRCSVVCVGSDHVSVTAFPFRAARRSVTGSATSSDGGSGAPGVPHDTVTTDRIAIAQSFDRFIGSAHATSTNHPFYRRAVQLSKQLDGVTDVNSRAPENAHDRDGHAFNGANGITTDGNGTAFSRAKDDHGREGHGFSTARMTTTGRARLQPCRKQPPTDAALAAEVCSYPISAGMTHTYGRRKSSIIPNKQKLRVCYSLRSGRNLVSPARKCWVSVNPMRVP